MLIVLRTFRGVLHILVSKVLEFLLFLDVLEGLEKVREACRMNFLQI